VRENASRAVTGERAARQPNPRWTGPNTVRERADNLWRTDRDGAARARPPLTKVTVNLVPRSVAALDEAAGLTGHTRTETINRAVQLWAWCQRMLADGAELHLVEPDRTQSRIHIF
jgi:hypothetical protein